MNRRTVIAVTSVAALALPAAAQAHVTLQPDDAPAGDFARLDVRVPNERDDEGTVKVQVQMPPGFVFASYEAVPGWTARIAKRKAAKPIDSHGEKITEEVSTITFTGDGKRGIIKPGQFRDFGLSVGLPDEPAGAKLTFKSLQTYEGGEVVRWIGAPDSEQPAPQVTLTAAAGRGATNDAGDAEPAADTGGADAAAAEEADSDGGGGDGLAIAALIVAVLGLAAGAAALMTARRGRTA